MTSNHCQLHCCAAVDADSAAARGSLPPDPTWIPVPVELLPMNNAGAHICKEQSFDARATEPPLQSDFGEPPHLRDSQFFRPTHQAVEESASAPHLRTRQAMGSVSVASVLAQNTTGDVEGQSGATCRALASGSALGAWQQEEPNSASTSTDARITKGRQKHKSIEDRTVKAVAILGELHDMLESAPQIDRTSNTQDAASNPEFEITTLMIRHIACRYSLDDVIDILKIADLEGTYDFINLPLNVARTANLGYLFINFMRPEHAEKCVTAFHGQVFGGRVTHKICEVCACRTQGIAASASYSKKGKQAKRRLNVFLASHDIAELRVQENGVFSDRVDE